MANAINLACKRGWQHQVSIALLITTAWILSLLNCPLSLASDSTANGLLTLNMSQSVPEFPSRFWNKNRRSTDLQLISPSMMNTEQLLESARSIRDTATCHSQRILNNVWLTMEQSKQYEGAKALGKILSLGYFSYRRALTPAELNNPLFSVLDMFSEDTIITHFKNYDVEFSSKTVMLSIRKEI